MRISLSEFGLKDGPDDTGHVTYKAIAYDVNSGREIDGFIVHTYLACGYKTLDDGTSVGVLVHGTRDDIEDGARKWKMPRLIYAPSGDGITVTSTEFHFVESLPEPFVRLVGCVDTAERPGAKQGFLYEGWHDGEGDWYPITVPDSEETVVRGCCDGILVCDALDNTDSIHIYSLENHSWSKIHTGLADEWSIDEIFQAGGGMYVIRGHHSGGKEFNLSWKA